MKPALAAAVGTVLLTAAGIAAAWRNVLRHLDRTADGPDTWDAAHQHLDDDDEADDA